jgi:hypothetical protein
MTHANNLDDCPPARTNHETLYSPYRPFPHGAKKALARQASSVEYPEEYARYVYVNELPDPATLEKWELTQVKYDTPEETWVTDAGEEVDIYEDRVTIDGRTSQMDPDDAKASARDQESFTRVDTSA